MMNLRDESDSYESTMGCFYFTFTKVDSMKLARYVVSFG